jgi:hypothetical protein
MSRTARLSQDHKTMLFEESRLSTRVVVKRGYRTLTRKAELERLGFGRSQRRTPTLLVPIWSPAGEIVLYQTRPNEPRIDKHGRPVKYETPGGASMTLDCHPFCRGRLGDPNVPLFVTEGVKKGDSLVSHGLCALALIGVWNFRGTNEWGGKTVLPEWEYVNLSGRKVYVVFDSDVMEKREVHAALSRLKAFLEHRGAEVLLIYLPSAAEGRKQGVDDYLAGHSVDELLAHATREMKRLPAEDKPVLPYRATPDGLIWDKPTQSGAIPTPLTNFTAKITADVVEDDGAEVQRRFEVEAELEGCQYAFTIPGTQFAGMGWPAEHLGANAIVFPGFGLKDHARAAIQATSGCVSSRRVYAHTGWRKIGGEWLYLYAGGAIGRAGRVDSVHVESSGSLAGRTLPDPPEDADLEAAVQASTRLLDVGDPSITVPLHSAAYLAALGETDFTIQLCGPTGEGKTELAALSQQHYGAHLDARHLLSWESTENAIEAQAFALKDTILVLDDFAPSGTSYDVQRWHRKADRVLRAKGNRAGRQRMRPDTTLRPEKPPRSLILSTGEDVPRGQSLRARMLILELASGALDWSKLTQCQQEAASGLYAQAMSGFLRWLAPSYEGLREHLKEERAFLRQRASDSKQHRRTPGIVADLALGLRYFLLFAHDCGAMSKEEAERFWEGSWRELGEVAASQSQHQVASEPTRRFRELLSAAIAGGRAHVADPGGDRPESPGAWGWRLSGEEWRPQGERVGWLEDEDLYLEPEAAYAAVQKQGRDSGEPPSVTGRTLRKRLHEQGLLLSVDHARQVLTVRRTLGGRRREVLHTSEDLLSFQTEPDQPDHASQKQQKHRDATPPLWSSFDTLTRPTLEHEPDHGHDSRVAHRAWPGHKQELDHGPDQQEPPAHADNSGNGRVGRVRVSNGLQDAAGEAHPVSGRRIRGRL